MESLDNLEMLRYSDGDLSTAEIRNTMQDVMQEHAAVYRTSETLEEGKGKIDEVVKSFENVKVTDKSLIWNTDMVETLELHNLLGCGVWLRPCTVRKQGRKRGVRMPMRIIRIGMMRIG